MENLRKALELRNTKEEKVGNLKKALEFRIGEKLEKAKYTKRTGGPGHYKYIYEVGSGKKIRDTKDDKKKVDSKTAFKHSAAKDLHNMLVDGYKATYDEGKGKFIIASKQEGKSFTANDLEDMHKKIKQKGLFKSPKQYTDRYKKGGGKENKLNQANIAALDDMGFSAKQADTLNKRGVTAKRAQKIMDTTENENLSDIDGLYKHLMGNESSSEAKSGVERYKGNMQRTAAKEKATKTQEHLDLEKKAEGIKGARIEKQKDKGVGGEDLYKFFTHKGYIAPGDAFYINHLIEVEKETNRKPTKKQKQKKDKAYEILTEGESEHDGDIMEMIEDIMSENPDYSAQDIADEIESFS